MASTAGNIKDLLPSLTTFELADLLDAINEELIEREVEVDIYSSMGEQGVVDWDEYERMYGSED